LGLSLLVGHEHFGVRVLFGRELDLSLTNAWG